MKTNPGDPARAPLRRLVQQLHELSVDTVLVHDVQRIMKEHGYRFERFPRNMEKEPPIGDGERWEAFAFCLYSRLVDVLNKVEGCADELDAVLAAGEPPQPETDDSDDHFFGTHLREAWSGLRGANQPPAPSDPISGLQSERERLIAEAFEHLFTYVRANFVAGTTRDVSPAAAHAYLLLKRALAQDRKDSPSVAAGVRAPQDEKA